MTRKSKQPGGHHPLTYHERTKKFRSSQYGTTTARLSTDSQLSFGDCALSLSPAVDPVATPSGHVYSREAIVQYLLQKTSELKKARANYNAYLEKLRSQKQQEADKKQQEKVQAFEDTQKATASSKKRSREDEPEKNALSVSYWLADFQPEHEGSVPDPPPERPPSPHTGQPLRLKDLRSLSIKRSSDGKPICALSDKTITTQPVVAVKEDVILEECFNDLVKPSMLHPISGDKLKSKHILKLQKGKSGFASSGPVEAKTYRPTIT